MAVLDLNAALAEIAAALDASNGAWESVRLWVVSRDGLISMKRLSGRPQDLVDITRLEEDDGPG